MNPLTLTTQSEQEHHQRMQPLLEMLPPNDIIDNRYSPATAPQVKLMYNILKVELKKTIDETTSILCLLRQRIKNSKTMQINLISSISLDPTIANKSTRSSFSNLITLTTTYHPNFILKLGLCLLFTFLSNNSTMKKKHSSLNH